MVINMKRKIIVIGGGMAGTSAAHTLTKLGYEVTIVEKNDRLGGRMKSMLLTDDIALEQGAGFVMNIYANTLRFLREQGLIKDLARYPAATPGIVRGGKIRFLGVRTIFGTALLSWKAKIKGIGFLLRVMWHWRSIDLSRPWKIDVGNVSIGDLRATAAGTELFDYFVQPALSGTWYWSPEDVAQTSEGLLLTAAKAVLRGGTFKMRGGLQRIPEKASEGSTVLLGRTVTRVERHPDGSYAIAMDHQGSEQIISADGIVCATTATIASRLFPNLAPERRGFIDGIRYSSVAYVGRTYPGHDVWSRGIAFPSKEGFPVSGVNSFRGQDIGWIKICAANKELCTKDEATILKTLTEGSRLVEGASFVRGAVPLSTFVWHWDEALPTLEKGHFERLRSFTEEEEKSDEPLVFAGDYIGVPFIEGAFTSGMQAAERLDRILNSYIKPS